MKLETLRDLYVEQLHDLYSAESQLVEALPKMAKAATNKQLQAGFTAHLAQTKTHVQRLEQIFQQLGQSARGKTCKGMQGIIEEGQEVMSEDGEEALMDAAIVGAAQRVEHYEMASYAAARTIAERMGNTEIVDLLQQTWDEENEADQKLSEIVSQVLEEMEDGAGQYAEQEQPARKTASRGKGAAGASRRM